MISILSNLFLCNLQNLFKKNTLFTLVQNHQHEKSLLGKIWLVTILSLFSECCFFLLVCFFTTIFSEICQYIGATPILIKEYDCIVWYCACFICNVVLYGTLYLHFLNQNHLHTSLTEHICCQH